jgi:hypothetical protein
MAFVSVLIARDYFYWTPTEILIIFASQQLLKILEATVSRYRFETMHSKAEQRKSKLFSRVNF